MQMMRRIVLVLTFALFTLSATAVLADQWVNGYTRNDGTYVQGHMRSSPDGNPYNNFNYPGNTNPYTGKTAPSNADTYLRNNGGSGSGGGFGSAFKGNGFMGRDVER